MPTQHRMPKRVSQRHIPLPTVVQSHETCVSTDGATGVPKGVTPLRRNAGPPQRGLTQRMHSNVLQRLIWMKALALTDRFRVIRTLDIAATCFPERPFRAALAAAQRAVRGMVKAELLRRYRTDRFQTVYGLTGKGADWLQLHGRDATASVRRVSDMTNPEHRLWSQFLVLCCEARGMVAHTEQELLALLDAGHQSSETAPNGLLSVSVPTSRGSRRISLRPDAVAVEADGLSWFEVDRSARGADRAASLRALVLSVGRHTQLGQPLRRVAVFTRTTRIQKRVVATLDSLAKDSAEFSLSEGRRILVREDVGLYAVIQTVEEALADGRTQLVDRPVGHVIVQELPIWLPRYRLDGRDGYGCDGWFDENYLPYKRPALLGAWPATESPLLVASH
jgi:hypothetical protein